MAPVVPFSILVQHIIGTILVWGLALVAGYGLGSVLKIRLGFTGSLMLGLVFWSIALFLLPFHGGLYIALAIAIALAVARLLREGSPEFAGLHRDRLFAGILLAVGCGVYASLILWNFTPMGNDATMLGTAVRVIANEGGLPKSYAPILPELYFPAVNLGLPSLGAIAVMLGGEVNSVVLGLAQLSYSAWILATYSVLRIWIPRPSAAVLAVAQAWDARWAQNTVSWGGFSTVASMAIGVFAIRLIWQYSRSFSRRSAIAIGLTSATMPMVHGISAAVWLYAIAPVLLAALLKRSHDQKQLLKLMLLAGATASAFLGIYLMIGQVRMTASAKEWTLHHILDDCPKPGTPLRLLLNSFDYLALYGENIFIWLGLASAAYLAATGRWRTALGILASVFALVFILANARWQILPGTTLLYPNRAVYWAGPITAIATALAWRQLRTQYFHRDIARTGLAIGIVLLTFTAIQHVNQYQKLASNPVIRREGWEALKWAEGNLQGSGAFVIATPHDVGSQLPVCAGVPTNAWHIHHIAMEPWNAIQKEKPFTHRLIILGSDADTNEGAIVFENATVRIRELPKR